LLQILSAPVLGKRDGEPDAVGLAIGSGPAIDNAVDAAVRGQHRTRLTASPAGGRASGDHLRARDLNLISRHLKSGQIPAFVSRLRKRNRRGRNEQDAEPWHTAVYVIALFPGRQARKQKASTRPSNPAGSTAVSTLKGRGLHAVLIKDGTVRIATGCTISWRPLRLCVEFFFLSRKDAKIAKQQTLLCPGGIRAEVPENAISKE
jgi:hypothetical protein